MCALTMFVIKKVLFLLSVSLSESNVVQQIVSTRRIFNFNTTSSLKQIIHTNSSITDISENLFTEVIQQEPFFDNNYSENIPQESDKITQEFHHGPQYESNWTFIDKENICITFSLFSISKPLNKTKFSYSNQTKINIFPTITSIPSRSLKSIYSLNYFLFTIRQYKTNTEKILKMEELYLKNTTSRDYEHFSNSLQLIRLNPKEKYSICIYYYQTNNSIQMPDLLICQDIMNDHSKHSSHGLLFILTQYSIILGMLIVLQSLFSMRKRRLAHVVHQHLVNQAHKIRSTLSQISLIRQSFSSVDATTAEQHSHMMNSHEQNKITKRTISSPVIVLSEPSISSDNGTNSLNEGEPCIKLPSSKNHVHFLLGHDEGSDNDNESDDIELAPQMVPAHTEPYSDRLDSLLSMAHILDINKPWSKHNQHVIPT